jgi:hypothetical protein
VAFLSSDIESPSSSSASSQRFGFSTRFGALAEAWKQYRILRELEAVPASVMKDVGFPAAERMHAA